jgi:hypothetical protein
MGKTVSINLIFFEFKNYSGVYTRRLTLNEFYNNVTYDEKNNLILENKAVALVYFRAGYTEKDYTNEVKK